MTPIQFANQPPTPTLGAYTGDAAQRAFARAVGRAWKRTGFDPFKYQRAAIQPQPGAPSMDEGDMAANLNATTGAQNGGAL